MAGPASAAPFILTSSCVSARVSCSGATTERISSRPAAPLTACPMPRSAAAASSRGSDSRPATSATTTPAVTAARAASVAITIVRLSYRSASEPAGKPATSIPTAWTAANSPARAGEPVMARMISG